MATIEMTDKIASKNIRALVVDDQMLSRELLCAELAEWGVHTEQASNGRDALAKVLSADRNRPFHIVFTDLRMPELSGLDLIAHIRRAGLDFIPRTVLVTAHDSSPQLLQDYPAPAHPDKILAKPATSSAVFNLLLEVCAII
jgi:CheY-like chemotaxis protein